MKKFIVFLLVLNFLSACESAKEGFTLKKDNSDEFLVEKKNPLVMPPNYEKLPKPEDFQLTEDNIKEDEFQNIISKNKNINTEKSKKNSSLEESIIEKIN
tara:strand:- start:232 stop:531 length:300 start_codon:yes stop_codon:yes gene_type:complete